MSKTLQTLANDWHQSHPYEKSILSVVPSSPFLSEIEDSLMAIYVASHYDYKVYKSASTTSVYDMDIDAWTFRKKTIDEELKKEGESLEKLSKKFAELQTFLDPTLHDEDEEEEDEEEVPDLHKEKGKQRIVAQVNKTSVKSKKEQEKQMAKQAKITQANMASSQEKLFSLQKEIEDLDRKIECYGQYREASLGFSRMMKRIVTDFEQRQDFPVLIKELADLHAYYDTIRRRYVPAEKCKGHAKGLCDVHHLPLSTPLLREQKEGWGVRCALYPK
jgi:hypothetical protein